jgi:L-lactate utilization protein LutB
MGLKGCCFLVVVVASFPACGPVVRRASLVCAALESLGGSSGGPVLVGSRGWCVSAFFVVRPSAASLRSVALGCGVRLWASPVSVPGSGFVLAVRCVVR